MEYLILWFDVDNKSYASVCSKKNLREGIIKVRSSKTGKIIATKDITECQCVSRFKFSKERKSYLKWEDKDKLLKKYPELKERCLCA